MDLNKVYLDEKKKQEEIDKKTEIYLKYLKNKLLEQVRLKQKNIESR